MVIEITHELKETLTKAIFLLDEQIEDLALPEEWRRECIRDRKRLTQVIPRSPVGEWFISPGECRRGRKAKY